MADTLQETPQQKTFNHILESLPPIFTRTRINELLPGLLTKKTMSNLSDADGPPYTRVANKIVYERESFVDWLRNR